jgi:uncharacterized protein (DUF1684 family)
MIKNILFYSLLSLAVVLVVSYVTASLSSDYSDTVNNQREEQQHDLNNRDSLKISKKLNYYPVNQKYITTAKVNTIDSTKTLDVKFTENRNTIKYTRVALLTFELNNTSQQITLFKNKKNNDYILPFTDSTNTTETHITGRYIPIDFNNQEYIDLDFNMAHNPYCAYDTNFTCAITPQENYIPIKIEAGEQRY